MLQQAETQLCGGNGLFDEYGVRDPDPLKCRFLILEACQGALDKCPCKSLHKYLLTSRMAV